LYPIRFICVSLCCPFYGSLSRHTALNNNASYRAPPPPPPLALLLTSNNPQVMLLSSPLSQLSAAAFDYSIACVSDVKLFLQSFSRFRFNFQI
jgi:hypothetical protein